MKHSLSFLIYRVVLFGVWLPNETILLVFNIPAFPGLFIHLTTSSYDVRKLIWTMSVSLFCQSNFLFEDTSSIQTPLVFPKIPNFM